jgi:hypothetical protein
MVQLDPSTFPIQQFWLAVILLVLLFLMSRIGQPRVRRGIVARAARIDGRDPKRRARSAPNI